ncbi:NADH-quinone oxidoreductase subunit L [Nonomuraea diastatica]|uniref:NADH-quinone oxidoreductase subunit L n=1 Tax=Nonomuraea diastatica TaxID=1848329 RepID=A0A4R4WV79_9ACTN|nr:NADH-quinone oxidoreductase subunit L [Nonomuraea diastatica]
MLWLLPGLPIATGAVLAVTRRADRVAPAVATAVAGVTVLLAGWAAVVRPAVETTLFARLPAGLAVDGLAAVMVVTVAVVALAVLVFAAGDIREERSRFSGLMLVFVGAMLVTVMATDFVVLLMGWELMGAMSYALIGFWWREPDRVRSASLAFVTTRAADLGLYLAAGCALAGTLSLGLVGVEAAERPWLDLIAGGVVVAALGKSAQLPFSFWLSRAMAGPSPVSALLHSATMVAAGAFLLLRLQPLLAATGWAATLVAWAGGLTALLLGAVAVAQRELKQLLAASTCAQVGFMVLAAGVSAVAGGTAHLVAHAAVKSLLFLVAGAWLTTLGTQELGELSGAARRHRLTGVTFTIGGLALAGLPPLSLWVTKDLILAAVDSPALHVVGLAATLLAAVYAGQAVIAVWRPGGGWEARPMSVLEQVPLPPLAFLAVALGLVGMPAVLAGWSRLLGAPAPGPGPVELALSGALAIAVVVLARLRPQRRAAPGFLRDWLRLESAARLLVWRPLLAAGRGLARFDDHVVDGLVRAVPRGGMAVARFARSPFEAGVDGVVSGVSATVARLGELARRPQTGQVHTYFAQAAVGLVLLAVVIALVR